VSQPEADPRSAAAAETKMKRHETVGDMMGEDGLLKGISVDRLQHSESQKSQRYTGSSRKPPPAPSQKEDVPKVWLKRSG